MQHSFVNPLICKPEELDFLKRYIAEQPEWFHQFTFDNGLSSPGRYPSLKKLHHLCLPQSLKGKTVIDIGAYEGFFSFHCEDRGADRVVACDRSYGIGQTLLLFRI